MVDACPTRKAARELVGCGGTLLDQQIVIVDPRDADARARRRGRRNLGRRPQRGPGLLEAARGNRRNVPRPSGRAASGPFLRTGDLGFCCDGELFITGRLKDLIIIRGLNHYPQDIELTVERVPSAAAARRPGPRSSSKTTAASGW